MIKKLQFLFTLLLLLPACINTKHEPVALFDAQGNAHPALLRILTITGIEHNGTISDIKDKTQAAWIRKSGTERWEMDKTEQPYHQELIKALDELDCIQERKPQHRHYKYLILMGSAAKSFKKRLAYAIKLLAEYGISADTIIILSGERPLNPTEEPFAVYALDNTQPKTMPITEADMMKYLVNGMKLQEQAGMATIEWYIVPMIKNEDGTVRRPITADTVTLFLADQPEPGTACVISSQPYAGYQEAVVKNLLPTSFIIDVAAPESSGTADAVHLDNLARWIFAEHQRAHAR